MDWIFFPLLNHYQHSLFIFHCSYFALVSVPFLSLLYQSHIYHFTHLHTLNIPTTLIKCRKTHLFSHHLLYHLLWLYLHHHHTVVKNNSKRKKINTLSLILKRTTPWIEKKSWFTILTMTRKPLYKPIIMILIEQQPRQPKQAMDAFASSPGYDVSDARWDIHTHTCIWVSGLGVFKWMRIDMKHYEAIQQRLICQLIIASRVVGRIYGNNDPRVAGKRSLSRTNSGCRQ